MEIYHLDRTLKDSIMERLKEYEYDEIADILEKHWCEIKPDIMSIVDRQYGNVDLSSIKDGLSMRCKVWNPLSKTKFITELDILYKYISDQGMFTHCLIFANVYCK